MVGDEQARAECDGLVADLLGGVDGEQDAAHRSRRFAADEPDRVPLGCESLGEEPFEYAHDVGHRRNVVRGCGNGHALRLRDETTGPCSARQALGTTEHMAPHC
ncbi:unannotated protein [freshwater metagenome]|uniref:Unannotated protein n=1 Tax=freshwater metagenome TaxID=449393 RepID=A0A6J7JQ63_9ZZZZ